MSICEYLFCAILCFILFTYLSNNCVINNDYINCTFAKPYFMNNVNAIVETKHCFGNFCF